MSSFIVQNDCSVMITGRMGLTYFVKYNNLSDQNNFKDYFETLQIFQLSKT